MKSIILIAALITLGIPVAGQNPPPPPPQQVGGGAGQGQGQGQGQGPGQNQGRGGGQGRRGGFQGLDFDTIDKNKDGKISKSEMVEWAGTLPFQIPQAQILQAFDQLDTNKDGFINKDEFKEMQNVLQRTFRAQGGNQFGAFSFVAGQLIQVLDTDGDKKLSRKEFDGMKTTIFDKLDKDKDGFLTAEELSGMTQLVPRQPGQFGGPGGQRGDGQGRQGQDQGQGRGQGQGGQSGQNNQGGQNNPGGQGGQRGGGQPGQGGPGGQRARFSFNFDELDKNKDGKITPDEWLGNADTFKQIDTNHDNAISKDELEAFNKRSRERQMAIWNTMVQSFDTNFDGKLSREEFGKITELFDRLDKNKDGFLANDELMALANVAHEVQIEATSGIDIDSLFKNLDKNGDGKIAPEEIGDSSPSAVYIHKHFGELDKNKDGFLTRDEIVGFVQAIAAAKAAKAAKANGGVSTAPPSSNPKP